MGYKKIKLLIIAALGVTIAAILFFRFQKELLEEPVKSATVPSTATAISATVEHVGETPNDAIPPAEVLPAVYTLIARVWTREGHLVPGAEVHCTSVLTAEASDTNDPNDIVFQTDAKGRAVQDFNTPGPYLLTCEHDGARASTPIRFSTDNIHHVDIVLRPAGEIRGQTVDTTGAPVANVAITGTGQSFGNSDKTTSNEDGHFILSKLVSDLIVVKADHQDYATTLSEPVRTGSEVRLVMTRGGGILITARDSHGSVPSPDLALELASIQQKDERIQGITARNGELKLEGLTPGDYELRSTDAARVLNPVQKRVVIAANTLARVELQVEAAASIRGQVVDRDTRAGISGVELYFAQTDPPGSSSGSATTDREGNFIFAGLAGGSVNVAPSKWPSKYGRDEKLGLIQSVKVGVGEQRTGVVIELVGGTGVEGKVVYENGDPAPGAQVTAWLYTVALQPPQRMDGGTTVADREGRFLLTRIPLESELYASSATEIHDALSSIGEAPREVYLQASFRTGQSEEIGPVVLETDAAKNVVLTLKSFASATVAGRVVRHDGGSVSHFTVYPAAVEESGTSAHLPTALTDLDGFFILPDILPGTYSFTLTDSTGSGVFPIDEQISVSAGQTLTNITLPLGTGNFSLTGVVFDEHDQVVRTYSIKVERHSESDDEYVPFYASAWTDDNGRFSIDNVHEGTYRLSNGSNTSAPWTMTVQTGTEVIVKLPPSAREIE